MDVLLTETFWSGESFTSLYMAEKADGTLTGVEKFF
jgi:hypothetical protein